jgi:hypothetical protein
MEGEGGGPVKGDVYLYRPRTNFLFFLAHRFVPRLNVERSMWSMCMVLGVGCLGIRLLLCLERFKYNKIPYYALC